MKHTKGPWTTKTSSQDDFTIDIINEDGKLSVAAVYHNYTDEAEANATLISAAPEMLEALELVLNDNRLMNAMSREQARAILDAVKKAKGE